MILLRSAAFNAWFFGVTFLITIFGTPMRVLRWQIVVRYARFWGWLVTTGLRVLCGITWEVTGQENLPLPGQPALIASMHQSAFDTIVWTRISPLFCYVMKDELVRIPLLGMIFRRAGMIPVDREAGTAALRSLLRAADRALAQNRHIVIFPEGTRVSPGVVVKLQPGVAALAARTGLPVIPVMTDSGLFWGKRAFRKTPGVIRVAILPPLPSGLPREELMRRLQAAFAEGAAALPTARARFPVDNSVG